MKQQPQCLWLCVGRACHLHHLSRCEAGDRSLLIVIRLSSVADVPTLRLFEEECVEPVVVDTVLRHFCRLAHVHYGDKWVERLKSPQLVVDIYRIQFDDILHSSLFAFWSMEQK